MRVLELSNFPRPAAGSFIPMVIAICEEARRRGHEPEAVFLEASRDAPWVADFERAGIRVRFGPEAGRREQARWLRTEVIGDDPGDAVLHSHFTAWDLPAAAAARGLDTVGVHWHVHTVLPRDPLTTARTAVKFTALGRSVSSYLCPAENIASAVRRRGAPKERIRIVPSAVDTREFRVIEPAVRDEARDFLGIPRDATVLLHFGWHWKIKGTDRFLEALADVRSRREVVGLSNKGGEKATAYAAELGIGDSVKVVDDIKDVRTLFAAADLLVAASRREGMPLAVIEALSCGVPVVATDIPGHAAAGRDVAACELVGHDPAEMAAAAERLLDRDPARAAREAADAREWVEANLGLEAYASKMIDHFEGRDPFGSLAHARA